MNFRRLLTPLLLSLSSLPILALVACTSDDSTDLHDAGADAADATADGTIGDDGSAHPEAGEGGDVDAGPGITGKSFQMNVTDTGVMNAANDLSTWTIEAFAGTPRKTYPGKGKADGSFAIPGLPAGEYLLHVAGQPVTGVPLDVYVTSTSRDIDLSYYAGGRADVQLLNAVNAVHVNVTGLDPWSDQSDLQVLSTNAGTQVSGLQLQQDVSGAPTAGATTLAMTVPWGELTPPRAIAAGDTTVLTELSPLTSDAGAPYVAVTKSLTTSSFVVKQGATLGGAMADVPLTEHVATTWKHPAFAFIGSDVGANATQDPDTLAVDVQPWGIDKGQMLAADGYPDLLEYVSGVSSDESLDLTYGNPFGADAGAFAGFASNFRVPVYIPLPPPPVPDAGATDASADAQADANADADAEAGAPTDAGAPDSGPVDAGPAAPMHPFAAVYSMIPVASVPATLLPTLTPVRSPTVSGLDATQNQSGVGTAPTIAWSAPMKGTPTYVRVTIYALTVNDVGKTTYDQNVAPIQMGTTGSSITLPDGLLQSGTWYFAKLEAIFEPAGVDPINKPLVDAYPRYGAMTIVSPFTP